MGRRSGRREAPDLKRGQCVKLILSRYSARRFVP